MNARRVEVPLGHDGEHYVPYVHPAEVKRLKDALHEIAKKTWDTQYDDGVNPGVVMLASEIHHIARLAVDPPRKGVAA